MAQRGTYQRTSSLRITAAHAGTVTAPLIISALPGQQAQITGGVDLELERSPLVGPEHHLFSRLPVAARAHTRVVALSALGLTDINLTKRGFCARLSVAPLELNLGNMALPMARYPNAGDDEPSFSEADATLPVFGALTGRLVQVAPRRFRFEGLINGLQYWLYGIEFHDSAHQGLFVWYLAAQEDGYPAEGQPFWLHYGRELGAMDPEHGATGQVQFGRPGRINHGFASIASVQGPASFSVSGSPLDTWGPLNDVWVHGYFRYAWADCHLPVTSFDAATHTVTMGENVSFGIGAGMPFYVYNAPEALDSPGEWVFDRETQSLLVWPPADSSTVTASALSEAAISLENTHDVELRDLFVEAARSTLVTMQRTTRTSFIGGVIRNGATSGLFINEGKDCTLRGTLLEGFGRGAVVISAGDRLTLEPAGNAVEVCEIRSFSRTERTYSPGVGLSGVGNRVTHSKIHDTPHSAILFAGNDHLIEANEISHACDFSSDCGAVYGGRDWGSFGNVIRNNWLHDITTNLPMAVGVSAIYLDDCLSGITVTGNVLTNIQNIALIHGGGRFNVMTGNLFVNSDIGLAADNRGSAGLPNDDSPPDSWSLLAHLRALSYRTQPWAGRYPALAAMPDDWQVILSERHWLEPEGSLFSNNAAFGVRAFQSQNGSYDQGAFGAYSERLNNLSLGSNPFTDAAEPRSGLSDTGHAAVTEAIRAIPFSSIGLPQP